MKYYYSIFTSLCFFCILSSVSFTQQIEISNPSFENIDAQSLPLSWTAQNATSSEIKTDNICHSGLRSICVVHQDYNSVSLLSSPIKFKVGILYKLSAFIKTQNAVTKPESQYPTSLPACISMSSFPFTNHSEAAGGTQDWKKIEVLFIATTKEDRISLNFGYNGGASGKVWFDDISLEEVKDITEYIPYESIKWYGKAFRFEDKGWIFMHIEGEPYQRGVQHGYLAASELKEFINKLAYKKNNSLPQNGWNDLRYAADAVFLRKYDEEYLSEMKGIADGAAKAGATIFGRAIDLLDIVTLNSDIDIDYSQDALTVTPNQITGKSFLSQEDDLLIQERLHKCSGFLATKSATKDSRIVFGQLFMWNGYTGPSWNIFVDVIPSKGNRLVYETFPGGIHSGTDFYINDKGIMIGETTVNQGPFNPEGTPMSNRIRKAAQYANNIDDVVDILTKQNNGLYTNDWLIGDTKNDETAILILGTYKYKLWRSTKNDFYGNQKDWYFSDNNNKSLDVRKEYRVNDNNAPYDLSFRPVNRDLSFTQFYDSNYGKIDAISGINLFNSSPVNRPHACDGKLTTSEMAERMMFFANYGKVTQRETFVNENGRIPDFPGAIPRLSLGYSVISPIFFTDKIEELRNRIPIKEQTEGKVSADEVKDNFSVDKKALWHNTVYPSSDNVNWFISGTAAYWNLLNAMPDQEMKAITYSKDELNELNIRLLYNFNREGTIAPINSKTVYNEYKQYQIPRIKGTYALHQLRLYLGNDIFLNTMNMIHNNFKEKDITNNDIYSAFGETAKKDIKEFISQWIERDDLPQLKVDISLNQKDGHWQTELVIKQNNKPYHFFTTVMVNTDKERIIKPIEVNGTETRLSFSFKDKPASCIF
ncbi:MAG: C45 family autoproteolytic acyltransferase/hydrolase, partial [Bacteroidota bacterium]|nr:C45 family autoproteolytic acyltransferase/hydrolase [Bacteroidota bacterium]